MEAVNLTKSITSTVKPYTRSDSSWKDSLHIAAAVANIVIFLLGTIGNGIVIWLAGFKMKKTVCLIWYLNLAVADFLFCALRILNAVREIMRAHWPFGMVLCKVNGSMKYFNLFASVFFLVVISMDRCILVTKPFWCRRYRNIKHGVFACGVVWLLAIAISLPYTVLLGISSNSQRTACDYRPGLKQKVKDYLRLSRFIIGFVIPLIIIIVSNSIIAIRLSKQHIKTSRSPTRLITLVVLAFFICWLPHHVFIFLKSSNFDKFIWIIGLKVSNFFAFFNSCVNPVLYFFMGFAKNHPSNQSLISIIRSSLANNTRDAGDSESLKMTFLNTH